MEFRNLDQHKAFIKKEANRLGITMNSALSTYYSRMLLERLSVTGEGKIVVKGSFSQYVHLGKLSRPVLDVDLSSPCDYHIALPDLYQAMYEASDDIVTFELLKTERTTQNGVYKIPLQAIVRYPKSKEMIVPIPIDYKENNKVIFETQYKPVLPLFQGDKKFYISTPSFEEHIAEKLYIISHNTKEDTLNTRVKDFYDIYKLHGRDYDPDKFSIYFQAMVMMYGGRLEDVSTDFLDKKFRQRHQELWEAMRKKYEFLDKDIEFDEVLYYVKAVLNEQIQKIRTNDYTNDAIALVRSRNK